MLARDVMTTTLITVSPDTPVLAIAQLMSDRGISGVPVLGEDGALLGLVTDGDLMRRLAADAATPATSFFDLFRSKTAGAAIYARSHGRRAADIMTTNLISVDADTTVEAVARRLETHRIRRVPVLLQGRMIGLVSRADLVRALLAPTPDPGAVPDEQIRRELAAQLRLQSWVDTFYIYPEVTQGHVTFHGFAGSQAYEVALRSLAEKLPGVRGVTLRTQPTPGFLFGVP